jgi:hypothetical protein
MYEFLRKTYWVVSTQFGFDPRRLLRSLRGIPRYLANLLQFRRQYAGALSLRPCLYDWYEEGGSATSEYFLQDLHVARKIFDANPTRHVDIGSRIDGFVAHVAAFREVEVFDIRPISSQIPGVVFSRADLMNPLHQKTDYCDSLSCLHALEHFGLGRYGDPLDAQGYATGLHNMAGLVTAGGVLYLSVPIGQERVEFNAHRIFDPAALVTLAQTFGLRLADFAWVDAGKLHQSPDQIAMELDSLGKRRYTLGIFTFLKSREVKS